MKRKLIRQGGGGYTIYLPKKWVESQGLDAGNTVELEETDAHMIVSSHGFSKREAHIDISDDPLQFVKTKLMNFYRLGYDRVTVTYTTARNRQDLKKALEYLLGYAVVSDTGKDGKRIAVIEGISEPSTERYDAIVARLFFIFGEILNQIENNDIVQELVIEAYKYDNFCRRAISKQVFRLERTQIFWSFHLQLIHAVRDAWLLSAHLAGRHISREEKDLLEIAKKTLVDLRNAHAKKNTDILLRVYNRRKITTEASENIFRKNAVAMHHLLDVINNLYLAASPLFSIISDSP